MNTVTRSLRRKRQFVLAARVAAGAFRLRHGKPLASWRPPRWRAVLLRWRQARPARSALLRSSAARASQWTWQLRMYFNVTALRGHVAVRSRDVLRTMRSSGRTVTVSDRELRVLERALRVGARDRSSRSLHTHVGVSHAGAGFRIVSTPARTETLIRTNTRTNIRGGPAQGDARARLLFHRAHASLSMLVLAQAIPARRTCGVRDAAGGSVVRSSGHSWGAQVSSVLAPRQAMQLRSPIKRLPTAHPERPLERIWRAKEQKAGRKPSRVRELAARRTVDLIWRVQTGVIGSTESSRSSMPSATSGAASISSRAESLSTSGRTTTKAVVCATALDPALADRLTDDVIRRIDRRARIERERRGL